MCHDMIQYVTHIFQSVEGVHVHTWSLKVLQKMGTSTFCLWGHVPFSTVLWRVQVYMHGIYIYNILYITTRA